MLFHRLVSVFPDLIPNLTIINYHLWMFYLSYVFAFEHTLLFNSIFSGCILSKQQSKDPSPPHYDFKT